MLSDDELEEIKKLLQRNGYVLSRFSAIYWLQNIKGYSNVTEYFNSICLIVDGTYYNSSRKYVVYACRSSHASSFSFKIYVSYTDEYKLLNIMS